MQSPNFESLIDRLPPQNIEAEESILGGIMIDPSAISRIADILTPEAFTLQSHQIIYQAMLRQFKQGNATDLLTLLSVLNDQKQLERIGGQGKLIQLVDRTVSAHNIDKYAELILDKWQRRRLIEMAYKLVNLGYQSHLSLEELFNQSDALYFGVRNDSEIEADRPEHISDVLMSAWTELEELNAGENAKASFIPTNFYDLDETIGGIPVALNTIAGRTGMGKSHFGNELAIRFLGQGYPVLFYALEMSKIQMSKRLIVRDAISRGQQIDILKMFKMNALDPDDWEGISSSLGNLSHLPLYIQDRADVTPTKVEADLQYLTQKEGKPPIVMIDYVQLMDSEIHGKQRYQELDGMLKRLRGISKKFNTPIINFAQVGQHVDKQADKRPTVSDIRESAGFAQESALILFLYNDEYYNKDTSDKGVMEVIVGKSRFSSGRTIKLLFDGQYGRFRNLKK